MMSPLRASLLASLSLAIALVGGCGARVTSVGGLAPDDDAGDATAVGDALLPDASASDAAAEADAACSCGAKVCGRIACDGHVCGACPATQSCTGGQCAQHCAGTPCVDDLTGQAICPGDLGGQHCAGGTQGVQVCTCDGSGPHGWVACGPCF